MKVNTLVRKFVCAIALTLVAAAVAPAADSYGTRSDLDPRTNQDLRQVFDAVESIAMLAANFERVANVPPQMADPNAGPKARAARQAMIRISAGATTGATMGAMVGRDKNALITGAIIGGIAGFVYDRAMYSAASHPPMVAAPAPPCAPGVQP